MRGAPTLPGPPAATRDPLGPAAAWLVAAVAALVLGAPPTLAAPAAAALTLVAFRRRTTIGLLAAAAAALGACAEAGPVPLLAGAALALAAGVLGRSAARGTDPLDLGRLDEVERHLARCRRTGAAADLAVAACPDAAVARAVAADLRISDSVRVWGTEVHAMLERDGLDRGGFAARAASRPGVALGWARYPEDALTTADLVETARPLRAEGAARPAGAGGPTAPTGTAGLPRG